jgi:hypothetical protein
MIDRRKLLAAGVAGWAGTAAAGPRRARPLALDLSGVWTNAWYTHLQRPKTLKSLVLSPAEAEAYETPRRALNGDLSDPHDELGQATSEFPDQGPGLARIHGEVRTSWIVDPPDGRIPWTEAAKARLPIAHDPDEVLDNVEDRDTDERCLTVPGDKAPIVNSHDGNVVQLVQTPGWLAIFAEKNHEVRLVRIESAGASRPSPGADPRLRTWNGESVGHWEGATLVIETYGLRAGATKLDDHIYFAETTRVTERLTRTGPAEIAYEFAVSDPTLFTRPWRAEAVFRAEPRGIFEFACHEGNYSLPGILRAARAAEKAGKSPADRNPESQPAP